MLNNKEKIEELLQDGWILLTPTFDLNYLLNLGVEKVIKEIGFFIANTTSKLSNNLFSILGEDKD